MSSNSNNRHELLERNVGLLAIFIVFAISWGALVEITPLIFQKTDHGRSTEPQTLYCVATRRSRHLHP